MTTRTACIRVALYVASISAAVVVIGGLLHTPLARPWLARVAAGCPVQASAEAVERARLKAARATQGQHESPAQPALGFVLDGMTSKDVEAWAEREHVSCEALRSGTVLSCKAVPASALGRTGPRIDELVLAFSPSTKRLVNIASSQFGLNGAGAAARLRAVASELEQQLGKPWREVGQRSGAYLDSAPLRTALIRYRFSHYQADVTATNLPGKGMVVREHYMSARD